MAHTFKELREKTAAQLKEIAAGIEHEAVQGYTQMNKDHLILAICKALRIDTFEHHVAKTSNKSQIKNQIKILKAKRGEALHAGDKKKVKILKRRIKNLKNKLHKALV